MTENVSDATQDTQSVEQINLELGWRVAELEEQWDQAAAALLRVRSEDKGWQLWGSVQASGEEGFQLETVKKIGKEAELQSTGNPLLKRAFELRYEGVFSKLFRLQGPMPPRVVRLLARPSLERVLMSQGAAEKNERLLYCRGNLFVLCNRVTQEVQRVPLEQITSRATDPDDVEVTAYYKRSYARTDFDGGTSPVVEWYPTIEWIDSGEPLQTEVNRDPVNAEWVIVDLRVNVPSGGHWGIPDAFAALPYAWAYSEYIRDASSLLKALSTIAWKVVGKTKTQAEQAGARLSRAGKSPGSTATMTQDTQLTAMPRAGQVDMNDGLALAAMVASALSVPVTSLLNNPAIGGGFGAVASLDGPTVASHRARQRAWNQFYVRVFRALGIKDLKLDFPKITEDPVHRQVASLATGRATGAIHADEYRNAYLEATDVTSLHAGPPSVEEYAQAQNALGFLQYLNGGSSDISGGDPLARQGNAGVAGSLGEFDGTNRRLDTTPGTGSPTGEVN
jgi:hypothetical protein